MRTSTRITTTCSLDVALSIYSSSISTIRRFPTCSERRNTFLLTVNRETNQKTLEEIAAAFGDHVVEVDEQEIAAEGAALETKAIPVHLEDARSA